MVRSLFWRRGGDMQGVVEGHFWSLTRYRIGRRFFGLDHADNVIFFPAYRKKTWGGWAAVTMSATSTGYLTSDTSAVNVLEDGHPLHWRASKKLQAFILEENKVWRKNKEEEFMKRVVAKVAESSVEPGGEKDDGAQREVEEEQARKYADDTEQQFRDALVIKCTSPGFAKRHLRLSRVTTILYKAVYFYLWGIAISVVLQAYLLFRGWLNPPARQGLKNIEDHVLHIPLLLFSVCVSGVGWAARQTQPVADACLRLFDAYAPGAKRGAASPDVSAVRAQQPAAVKREEAAVCGALPAGACDVWWARALLLLLCVFSLLCVL